MSKTHPGHDSAPLTPSQLVFHDNVVAAEQMPDDMVRRLAQRRLYLSSADATADLSAHLKRHADLAGFWEIDLPAKSTVGLPGRTAERLDLKSAPKNILGKTHLDAFRPPWADHVFHPKLSGVPDAPQTLLRTIKGRRFRPTYGVFGSDDRKAYSPSGYPWQCIGRVFTTTDASKPGWSWSGSGVLVGPRHVLTAGQTPGFPISVAWTREGRRYQHTILVFCDSTTRSAIHSGISELRSMIVPGRMAIIGPSSAIRVW